MNPAPTPQLRLHSRSPTTPRTPAARATWNRTRATPPAHSHRSPTAPGQKEDPGKVLGIISLVATLSTFLGFNFLGPIVGIITGHMARKNSRSAGFGDNEMGKWGFILGIVFISVAVLGGLLGLSIAGFAGLAGLLGA